MYDAIIIGAGPAGLQAAMALSRVRRPHLIISIPNSYRNVAAAEMHTFLTRDGTPPLEFVTQAREQLNGYGFAKYVDGKVVSTQKVGNDFEVKLEDGTKYNGRKVIVATGAKDVFLPVEGTAILPRLAKLGFAELWGTDIVHCVFCGGYEHRDQLCAVIGIDSPRSFQSAMSGLTVASSMQLFPNIDNPDLVPAEMKGKLALLEAGGFSIMPFKKITNLSKDSSSGDVVIHLSDGSQHRVDWILYRPPTVLTTPELVSQLEIELNPMGDIKVGPFHETSVAGVFAAGDCVNFLKHVPGAVNEGFLAGMGTHLQLTAEDLEIARNAVITK
jgi:thioredoxin reductase